MIDNLREQARDQLENDIFNLQSSFILFFLFLEFPKLPLKSNSPNACIHLAISALVTSCGLRLIYPFGACLITMLIRKKQAAHISMADKERKVTHL